MERKLTIGEWIAEWEKAKTFKQMSFIDDGTLHIRPHTRMQYAFAYAIQRRLDRDGIAVVVR